MDFVDGPRQNLADMCDRLEELTEKEEQPAPTDWARIRKDIRRCVVFARAFMIPEVPEPEPGYKSGNGHRLASYVGRPSKADVEIKLEDSSAGPVFDPDVAALLDQRRP